MRAIHFIILLSLSILATPVRASFHTAKDGSKVFVLQGKDQPAKVMRTKDLPEGDGKIMRMPDLGDSSGEHLVRQPRPHSEKMESTAHAQSRGKKASHTIDTAAIRPLKFAKEKIKGTLRLPRVKFARVGVPLDIREELPSLDFTSKTLKNSDF